MESVKNFIEEVRQGKINIVEHTYEALKKADYFDKEYNCFTTISED